MAKYKKKTVSSLEEIKKMFEDMGLGTEKKRQQFIQMIPQETEFKEYKTQHFIRISSSTGAKEDNYA